ncbi:MAG: hypothetical protein K9L17_04645 [Clostridiales bacterium]|nr:hypothetical protein [Clostridiales bacterium]MCF8021963.1 hypothetical protein [Clostridiales bacterium]
MGTKEFDDEFIVSTTETLEPGHQYGFNFGTIAATTCQDAQEGADARLCDWENDQWEPSAGGYGMYMSNVSIEWQ